MAYANGKEVLFSPTVNITNIDGVEYVDSRLERFDAQLQGVNENIREITTNVSKNVLILTEKSGASNGITYTIENDGITLNGTATANVSIYKFFNTEDFIGTFTFGYKTISGTGSTIYLQIPTGTNIYDHNKTITFEEAPSNVRILIGSGASYDNKKIVIWANEGDTLMDYQPNYVASVSGDKISDNSIGIEKVTFKKETGSENVLQYSDIAETTKSGVTYSITDGVIKLNGTATAGLTIPLGKVNCEGTGVVSVEKISGICGGYVIVRPVGGATLFEPSASRNRKTTFNNNNLEIFINKDVSLDNLTFKVWVNAGLSAKPFSRKGSVLDCPNPTAVVNQSEYNTLPYNKLDDDKIYYVYGKQFSICNKGTISRINNDTSRIAKFAVLSDLHYTDSEDFYKRVFGAVNKHDVDFCIMLGDILDSGYYHKVSLYEEQYAQFKKSIKLLGCNNYPFCGNHDEDAKEFARHGVIDFGEMRFIYFWADYSSTSLNSMGSTGIVTEAELLWIEEQLANSPAKVNILGCHYSISRDSGFVGYIVDDAVVSQIQSLAETYNVKLYLNGHEHDGSVTVGTSGVMNDVNFPNGHYAYCICELTAEQFNVKAFDSNNDTLIKEFNINLV